MLQICAPKRLHFELPTGGGRPAIANDLFWIAILIRQQRTCSYAPTQYELFTCYNAGISCDSSRQVFHPGFELAGDCRAAVDILVAAIIDLRRNCKATAQDIKGASE